MFICSGSVEKLDPYRSEALAALHGWTPKAYKQSPEPLMPYHINEQRKGRKRKGHRKEKERQDKTIPEEHIKKQEQTTHHRNKNSE
jgi:hypothetical protein